MKKSIAFLMILAIVLSFGATAFAATDYYGTAGTVYPDDIMPPGQGPNPNNPDGGPHIVKESNVGLLILLMEDDTLYEFVPMYQVTNIEYKDASSIKNSKDREAFAEAYKEAKAVEGKHLRKAYWFNIPDTYTLDDEHYAKYTFACEGSHVEVTVNGEPVEVVSINGRTSYIAKVTARGTIAIYSDK